jgi:hypothetical protein
MFWISNLVLFHVFKRPNLEGRLVKIVSGKREVSVFLWYLNSDSVFKYCLDLFNLLRVVDLEV